MCPCLSLFHSSKHVVVKPQQTFSRVNNAGRAELLIFQPVAGHWQVMFLLFVLVDNFPQKYDGVGVYNIQYSCFIFRREILEKIKDFNKYYEGKVHHQMTAHEVLH